jgi:hypothetical protein
MADPEITDLIVRYGDMDRPDALIRRLLTKKKILMSFGIMAAPAVRAFLKEVLM